MSEIILYTDSCSSLTKDLIEKCNVKVIPIYFTIGEKEYDPLKEEISVEDFYNTIENNLTAKTSAINPTTFCDIFEKELAQGNDVIYFSMSSGLSSTYNNAVSAERELNEKYPGKMIVIDTLKGGMGMAFDIEKTHELIEKGLNIQQIKEEIDKNKLDVECLFAPGSIDYLKRSGRISSTLALGAKVMNISPIINANESGKLAIKSLCIGRKKTLTTMVNRVATTIHETLKKIYLCYTNNKGEMEFVFSKLKALLPSADIKVSSIDCSLGCHCGPRTLALFYRRKAKA